MPLVLRAPTWDELKDWIWVAERPATVVDDRALI
jgi:hypothetical protein